MLISYFVNYVAPELFVQPILWHPNVDMTSGRIFLPMDWSPVLKLYSVVFALQLLFFEPSVDNIHNFEAASLYDKDPIAFERHVHSQGVMMAAMDPSSSMRDRRSHQASSAVSNHSTATISVSSSPSQGGRKRKALLSCGEYAMEEEEEISCSREEGAHGERGNTRDIRLHNDDVDDGYSAMGRRMASGRRRYSSPERERDLLNDDASLDRTMSALHVQPTHLRKREVLRGRFSWQSTGERVQR